MVALRHPLSGTLYEQVDDPPGAVRVVGRDGKVGMFDDHGRYLSGDRRSADIAMCRWVSDGKSSARSATAEVAADNDDEVRGKEQP